ncbi:MAG: ABC transporter substrate-binding protein [Candidatus Bathyarchaeia archaeon]|jgi:iron complex transport system substrate-binding protein
MKKPIIFGIILVIILVGSLAVGYSQNWFQPTETTPEPTATPTATTTTTPQPTETPQATQTPNPTATAQPTATPTPTPVPSTIASMNLVLEVYGNANMDDKIDQQDVTYVNKIIAGTATSTKYADANNDGKVDSNDVTQINGIINGNASQIVLLDGLGRVLTVHLPVNRIVVEYIQQAELARILKLEDKVVGVDYCVDKLKSIYFPENAANIVSVGQMYTPDYEKVLALDPDVLLTFSNTAAANDEKASKLPGVDVVFLGLYYPNVTNPEDSKFLQGILKAGYIFDRVTEATDYANWLLNLTNTIRTTANAIPESQKQTVMLYTYPYSPSTTIKAYATIDTLGQVCILSGGQNIVSNMTTYFNSSSVSVDAEWVIANDPDYIFLHTVAYTFSGLDYADPAQGLNVNSITSIKQSLQTYLSQPMFANLTAVKNNHVYIIAGDFRNNAMGGVLGAVYLAKTLYPTQFSDLNPETIHQEYITKYLRLNYDLDTSGVFMYPGLVINGDIVGYPNGAT